MARAARLSSAARCHGMKRQEGPSVMRIAVLQHVEFEGPAAVADWAAARGFPLCLFHLHRDPTLPSLADFEMLTVMGGPMSANDEARLGWLGPEIALVRDAIAADKTVLGICLGAQIIAKALGARIYPGSAKEIGWFPVQRTAGSHPFFDGVPDNYARVPQGERGKRRAGPVGHHDPGGNAAVDRAHDVPEDVRAHVRDHPDVGSRRPRRGPVLRRVWRAAGRGGAHLLRGGERRCAL